tara:strand:+ start:143 stop:916 length:774 start_codon:yes stop_codon:yes gene_type:complete
MNTRKNHTSKKSNNKFRKTRSKRQTRNSKKKTRSKRGGGQVLSTFFNTQEPPSQEPPSPEPPSPEPPVCPICTEESIENCITTQCGHKFHKDCLRLWCRQRREETTCPSCRAPIGRICRELLFTELEKNLFHAIKVGEIVFAKQALAAGINDNWTPKYDNNNMLLLDINVRNKDGDTPLILAAKTDQVDIVELLLMFGAEVDVLNDDGTAAFHVTDNDYIKLLLFQAGTEYYDPIDDVLVGGKKKSKKTRKQYKPKR